MTRRRKPSDPQEIVAKRIERQARDAEAKRLEKQGATVKRDRAGQILSAYRSNVFRSLLEAGGITPNQYDAAYRLAQDWAAWKGLDGKPERSEFVDGGSGAAELVNDRMIRAGRDVAEALASVGLANRDLLEALMEAVVEHDRPMLWRGIVERVTGETRQKEQRERVVGALENLRRWYELPKRRVAA